MREGTRRLENNKCVTKLVPKGEKQKLWNYWLVSSTSIIAHMMESIAKEEISNHLGKLKIIKPIQRDFRKDKSSLKRLIKFLENVKGRIDGGEPVDTVCLDFQKKAFD